MSVPRERTCIPHAKIGLRQDLLEALYTFGIQVDPVQVCLSHTPRDQIRKPTHRPKPNLKTLITVRGDQSSAEQQHRRDPLSARMHEDWRWFPWRVEIAVDLSVSSRIFGLNSRTLGSNNIVLATHS